MRVDHTCLYHAPPGLLLFVSRIYVKSVYVKIDTRVYDNKRSPVCPDIFFTRAWFVLLGLHDLNVRVKSSVNKRALVSWIHEMGRSWMILYYICLVTPFEDHLNKYTNTWDKHVITIYWNSYHVLLRLFYIRVIKLTSWNPPCLKCCVFDWLMKVIFQLLSCDFIYHVN